MFRAEEELLCTLRVQMCTLALARFWGVRHPNPHPHPELIMLRLSLKDPTVPGFEPRGYTVLNYILIVCVSIYTLKKITGALLCYFLEGPDATIDS